jgi:hypothetical protein
MNRQQKEALAELGIELESYRIERGDLPHAVGLALRRNDRDIAVIEQVPRGWGGDDKWRFQAGPRRSNPQDIVTGSDGRVRIRRVGRDYRTQREAIAAVARSGLLG